MNRPLCVDLDGTLVKTDTLYEAVILLLKQNPLNLFSIIAWLFLGRSFFKNKIFSAIQPGIDSLPINDEFLEFLKEQHSLGREIYLVTASHISMAEKFLDYFPFIKEVIASDDKLNLKGKNKKRVLNERFGEKQYDYAGNSNSDLYVWESAYDGIVVNAKNKLLKKAKQLANIQKVFNQKKFSVKVYLKALRVHQYSKNTLIFIPLLTSHLYWNYHLLIQAILAFISFCMLSSGVYILNDLVDLEADRKHQTKKNRPFASGALSIQQGIFLIPFLYIASLVIAFYLPLQFLSILALYFILTFLYSFYLKKLLLVDVFVLAILYTLRIFAGIETLGTGYSVWLISFSVFFFLSLAFVKRYNELYFAKKANKKIIHNRGYIISDLNHLSQFGIVSGYLSTLVFALYLNSETVKSLYREPNFLWPICVILLFWVTRIWTLAMRGKIHEDPVLFALKDKVSFFVIFLIALIAVSATLL